MRIQVYSVPSDNPSQAAKPKAQVARERKAAGLPYDASRITPAPDELALIISAATRLQKDPTDDEYALWLVAYYATKVYRRCVGHEFENDEVVTRSRKPRS